MSEPVVHEEVTDSVALPYIGMTRHEFTNVIITGLVTGLVVGGLYFLLNQFVFGAVLCRPQSTGDCSQAPHYAMIVALIIGTIGGVANLARVRVYRPLLVGLAVAIAFWGVHTVIAGFAWYWALVALMVLFALAYAAFAWVARTRNFILAVVVTVVLVVIARWALVA